MLVSASFSVLERAKAELGSVFAMVPGILVSKEEVIGWSEDVLNHDSVSPGTEADSNGGPLVRIMSPAGLISGEK